VRALSARVVLRPQVAVRRLLRPRMRRMWETAVREACWQRAQRHCAIASAVAMLGSRKPQERAAAAVALALIADHDVGTNTNRKLVEFQEAFVAAGGIPLIVRALGARPEIGCGLRGIQDRIIQPPKP
jgi:hypothetical protein